MISKGTRESLVQIWTFCQRGNGEAFEKKPIKLDSAKAQILDRLISLTVGIEMPRKMMINSRSHLVGYLRHYLSNVLYLFPYNEVGWVFLLLLLVL